MSKPQRWGEGGYATIAAAGIIVAIVSLPVSYTHLTLPTKA